MEINEVTSCKQRKGPVESFFRRPFFVFVDLCVCVYCVKKKHNATEGREKMSKSELQQATVSPQQPEILCLVFLVFLVQRNYQVV